MSAAERAADLLRDPRWGETPEQRVAALMSDPCLLRAMAAEADAARIDARRRKARERRPCPVSCTCICHDTGGSGHDHEGASCPGKGGAS